MEKKKISVCLLCFVYVLLYILVIVAMLALNDPLGDMLAYLGLIMMFLLPVVIIISIVSLIKNRKLSDLIFVLLSVGLISFFYWVVWPSYRGGPMRDATCAQAYDCVCKSNNPNDFCNCKHYENENKIRDVKCPYDKSYKIEGES